MNAALLDTLVKLAGLGAGGICIFAIFWVGWLISKLPRDATIQQHRTLRLFMGMTIAIAVIAFASGIANAWFNAKAIAIVEGEKAVAVAKADSLTTEFSKFKADTDFKITEYKAAQIRNDEVIKSLAMVVDEKELAAKEQDASPEIRSHIRILKNSIDRLSTPPHPDATTAPQ